MKGKAEWSGQGGGGGKRRSKGKARVGHGGAGRRREERYGHMCERDRREARGGVRIRGREAGRRRGARCERRASLWRQILLDPVRVAGLEVRWLQFHSGQKLCTLRRALETSPELSQASVATRLHGLFNAAGRRRVAGRAGGALRSNWSPAQTPLAKIAFGASAFWNRPQPFREPLRVMLVEECEHAVRMDLAGAVTSYPELRQGATRKAMPRC